MSSKSGLLPRVGSVVVVLALAGCAFAVDPATYGERCVMRGRDTECGACLENRCQPAVDACCLDESCDGLLDVVERCASAHDESCDEVRRVAGSSGGARKALAACASERCRGHCERGPDLTTSVCTETRFGYQGACACKPGTSDAPANRYQCDAARFPGTRCCASSDWPSAGNQCACLFVNCSSVRDGCSCFLTDTFDPDAERQCGGAVCCQSARSCRCGTSACAEDETPVESCNALTTPCTAQSVRVDRCSLP